MADVGRIEPRSARAIVESPWSIGGETLDRDFAVYENDRDYVGELGATCIRPQAAWQKCERKPGRIDLGWLYAIVDDALARGVRPSLELSYSSTNYPGGGGARLGGGIPTSVETLAAWDHWVATTARHFRNPVRESGKFGTNRTSGAAASSRRHPRRFMRALPPSSGANTRRPGSGRCR